MASEISSVATSPYGLGEDAAYGRLAFDRYVLVTSILDPLVDKAAEHGFRIIGITQRQLRRTKNNGTSLLRGGFRWIALPAVSAIIPL
jgi:hypothetical protein